jgi:transcription antitermination factor NusG
VNNRDLLEKKWYAVFTKPRWEKKVVDLLNRASIENYCPTTKVERQWSDRKKMITEPLFKSYVFVNVHEKQKWEVKGVYGVINYVNYLGKPAVIKPNEIEAIRQFLNKHEYVSIQNSTMNQGDLVKINTGAFTDMEAEVVSIRGQKVLLNIPSIGLALVATHTDNASLLKSEKTINNKI